MRRLMETYKEQIKFHKDAIANIAEKMMKIALCDEDKMDVLRITRPHKTYLLSNREKSRFVDAVVESMLENGERHADVDFDSLINFASEITGIYKGDEGYDDEYSKALELFVSEGYYSFTLDW
ncbi:MAG: hypothetical protein ACRDD8_15995 [Bacteroidales bacterium]